MIQVNLLPDIKKEYLKAQRVKRAIILGSFFVSAAAVSVVVLLFLATWQVQGRHIDNLQEDIDDLVMTLKDEPDLNKILTVQNQLLTLPELHQDEPDLTRIFGYLNLLTPPTEVALNKVELGFEGNNIVINGEGDTLRSVNTYVDTIKNAQVSYVILNGAGEPEQKVEPAFSDVVLENVNVDDAEGAFFQINAVFNQVNFDITLSEVTLIVPDIVTSQSETERPRPLFEEAPAVEGEGQ